MDEQVQTNIGRTGRSIAISCSSFLDLITRDERLLFDRLGREHRQCYSDIINEIVDVVFMHTGSDILANLHYSDVTLLHE